MFARLEKNAVFVCNDCRDKEEALGKLVNLACNVFGIGNCDEIFSKVIEREAKLSTGIGLEIAVPHCRSEQVSSVLIGVLLIPDGINYNSVDGKPVKLIFLIISPKTDIQGHIVALSTISHTISDETLRQKLLNSKTSEELYLNLVESTKL